MKRFLFGSSFLLFALTHALGEGEFISTSFEAATPGPLTTLAMAGALWSAEPGHAQVTDRFASEGRHALHLLGGEDRRVTLSLEKATVAGMALSFRAERWTRRAPYRFRVEVEREGSWESVYVGDDDIRVGRPFLSSARVALPAGIERLRFVGSAAEGGGTLIDNLAIRPLKPMRLESVEVRAALNPLLKGKPDNPALWVTVRTSGSLEPIKLTTVRLAMANAEAMAKVRLYHGDLLLGGPLDPRETLTLESAHALVEGSNELRVSLELKPEALLSDRVEVRLLGIEINGQAQVAEVKGSSVPQRIGVALRTAGQDDCHTYRIPGLATTNEGTLIAVYDNRYRGSGDLPGDIDVGMSRSTDGGQTWEPMRVIMDMGEDPRWQYDGIGDPSILVDRRTGRVWVAATWSHGNRSWHGSGPGLEPEETGQLMLAYSDDDGLTWSRPVNITKQIKRPEWRFVLQGPGKGITMRDGTLVFPAQFRGKNAEPVNGKPSSTLIYSKDRGETWVIGTGVKLDTTEAQLVELGDGSLMINCRDNRNRESLDGLTGRTVAITRDLGQTWTLHSTDRRALTEPVCMASLIRMEHEQHGPLLIFSNPASAEGRFNMTLKVSQDEGMTWPERWHTLYDERSGAGYSCLTRIDEDHVGVLYEGHRELYFLRYSVYEWLGSEP